MHKLTPTPEQEQAIEKMVKEKTRASLNGSTMGAGKTLTGVEVARRIDAKTILLIAPLGTRLGWKVTFERQGVTLPFRWVNSTADGKQALADWQWQLPGIYFVGVEYFARLGWVGKARSKVWAQEPDIAMFDEAHRGQNRKSKTHKTLKQVKAGYKMSMSGTPTGNRFEGAWAVTSWLWPTKIDKSFHSWCNEWCEFEYNHFSSNGKKVVGEETPGAFFNSLPCYIRLQSELKVDCIEDIRYVELSAPQRKAYNNLEKDMMTWVEGNPLVVEFPITLRARLRQASLGMFSVDAEGEVSFASDCKSTKIDAMLEVLEDDWDGEPALILTDSRKFADVVVARLGDNARPWHGSVSQAKREEYKQEFINGTITYIVAVTSAIAEGVDGMQHGTRNMLWLSRSDNRILNEQAMARVLRQGQTRQVRSVEIIAVDTYDSGVLSSQLDKAIKMNKILKEGK
jgi:non-specific serine/threonine protein kinase